MPEAVGYTLPALEHGMEHLFCGPLAIPMCGGPPGTVTGTSGGCMIPIGTGSCTTGASGNGMMDCMPGVRLGGHPHDGNHEGMGENGTADKKAAWGGIIGGVKGAVARQQPRGDLGAEYGHAAQL